MLRAKLRSLKNGLLRRPEVESGMSDEVRFHIEARAVQSADHRCGCRDHRRRFGVSRLSPGPPRIARRSDGRPEV
jgi:hypothetical protein